MKAEELAILIKARDQHAAAMTQLAPSIREFQRALRETAPAFAAMEHVQKQAATLHRALDIPGLKALMNALSNPALLDTLRSLQKDQERMNLILQPTGGMSFVGPLVLHTPLPVGSTVEIAAPIYVPEDDPAWLRDQLADKDAEIAGLKAELRTYRFAEAFGSGDEHEPFPPSVN